jgi:uncharacterized protein YbcV (DUF1398 family)
MDTQLLHDTLHKSESGQITFGEVVATLSAAGVESYRADLLTAQETFYTPEGTHVEPMTLPATTIAADFDAPAVLAAIRAAQADTIRYPEFLVRIFHAGCSAYHVFITGRKVIYFGRKGEFHIEEFPSVK